MGSFDGKFESAVQTWTTPKDLFDRLDAEFHFETDLAADDTNHLCDTWLDETIDAFSQKWQGICWLNPPFGSKGRQLKDWVQRAYIQSELNKSTIVLLIPARTNCIWWHKYCMKGEIRLICGRVKFSGLPHGLPQPLALVVFGPDRHGVSSFYL